MAAKSGIFNFVSTSNSFHFRISRLNWFLNEWKMSAKPNEIPSNCCWIYHSEFTKKLDNLPMSLYVIGCRLDRKANFYFTKIIAMLLLCFCFCFLNCWVTLLFSFLKTEIDVQVSYEILRHFEFWTKPLLQFFFSMKKKLSTLNEKGSQPPLFSFLFFFLIYEMLPFSFEKLNYPYSNSRNGFLLYLFLSQE